MHYIIFETLATITFVQVTRFFILTFFVALSCGDQDANDKLFETLYHRTFIPKDGVTIEFIDSTSYIVQWGPDSVKKSKKELWRIESRLTGTYLVMNSADMKLVTLSDSVITFSKGEFGPRFKLKH